MMRLLLVLLLLVWFSLPTKAQQPAPLPRTDTQEWTELQFIVPLHPKVDFTLVMGLRAGRNLSHLVDERSGAQLAFKLNKYLTLTPGYLYRSSQPARGRKIYEHWVFGAATVRIPLPQKFRLSQRNFYEYRYRHSQADTSRYRNRIQLERPIKIGGRTIIPFVADEPWYDFKLHDWSRNRFFVGFTRHFAKKFSGEFFYMRQSDKRTRPGDLNVIGSTFRINF